MTQTLKNMMEELPPIRRAQISAEVDKVLKIHEETVKLHAETIEIHDKTIHAMETLCPEPKYNTFFSGTQSILSCVSYKKARNTATDGGVVMRKSWRNCVVQRVDIPPVGLTGFEKYNSMLVTICCPSPDELVPDYTITHYVPDINDQEAEDWVILKNKPTEDIPKPARLTFGVAMAAAEDGYENSVKRNHWFNQCVSKGQRNNKKLGVGLLLRSFNGKDYACTEKDYNPTKEDKNATDWSIMDQVWWKSLIKTETPKDSKLTFNDTGRLTFDDAVAATMGMGKSVRKHHWFNKCVYKGWRSSKKLGLVLRDFHAGTEKDYNPTEEDKNAPDWVIVDQVWWKRLVTAGMTFNEAMLAVTSLEKSVRRHHWLTHDYHYCVRMRKNVVVLVAMDIYRNDHDYYDREYHESAMNPPSQKDKESTDWYIIEQDESMNYNNGN